MVERAGAFSTAVTLVPTTPTPSERVTALGDLVPDDGWAHDGIDDNADSHVRAMLVGPSVTVPVDDGSLQLGTWQSILFIECDGPRTRQVRVLAET